MPFRIPRTEEVIFPEQAEIYPADFSILANAQNGDGVLSGCEVSVSSGLTLQVSKGAIRTGGSQATVLAQTVTLLENSKVAPRFDLIVAYGNGTVSYISGTDRDSPTYPDVPVGSVVLAAVHRRARDESVESYQIIDKRLLVRANTIGPRNVMDYGAVGDGVTDDTVAIQAAINAVGKTGEVVFPTGTYVVSNSIILPGSAATAVMSFYHLKGYGAELLINQAVPIFKRMPTTQPSNWAFLSFIFEGFKFRGISGGSLGVGIQLAATRNSSVRDCSFYNLDRGFDGYFCLNLELNNCHAEECSTYGFSITSGSGAWTGGSTSNSSSNHTRFIGCYAIGKGGQPAQYRIRASDTVLMEHCVAEGGAPVYNVDYASDGNGINFVINNMHFENGPTGAHIRVVTNRGAFIRGLHISPNYGGVTIVDGTDCGSGATLHIQEVPDWTAGLKFKHTSGSSPGGYRWRFEKFGISNSNPDMTQATNWFGSVVPSNLTIEA